MSRLISSPTLWGLHEAQGRTDAMREWARANNLDPDYVSVGHNVTIEDSPTGPLIRFHEFQRTDHGAKYECADCGSHATVEERTVPLVVQPPADWPVYALPGPA